MPILFQRLPAVSIRARWRDAHALRPAVAGALTLLAVAAPAGLSQTAVSPAVPPQTPPAVPVGVNDSAQLGKLSPLADAPDWNQLKAYANTFTYEEFKAAWTTLYSEQAGLPPPLAFTPEALVVPTGNSAAPEVKVPFVHSGTAAPAPARYWRKATELPPLRGRPVLSDLHIALDPGHIGGQWARMEERHLSFVPGESVQEGALSLETARVLKERLLALGAHVTLVRDKLEPVTDRRPADLHNVALLDLAERGVPHPAATYEGLQGTAKALTLQWQAEKLFYRVSEIRARASRVNHQIRPDLVLCLHLNAEGWGDSDAPQYSPENHLHVLVNGCYSAVELAQADVRHEMLTRLFNRVHEEEVPLAGAVAEAMAASTGLPPYLYRTPNARRAGTNRYVYARNLLANRTYQCPVVYLEPYVMNHEETYRRLLAGHYVGRTLIGGQLTRSALEDYVSGVVAGLVSYYQNQRRGS